MSDIWCKADKRVKVLGGILTVLIAIITISKMMARVAEVGMERRFITRDEVVTICGGEEQKWRGALQVHVDLSREHEKVLVNDVADAVIDKLQRYGIVAVPNRGGSDR